MRCASLLSIALALTCSASASAIPNHETPTTSSSDLDPEVTPQATTPTPPPPPMATPAPKGAPELTPDNFDETIRSGYWFVKHYASWCGHSIRAAPGWAAAHAAYANGTVLASNGAAVPFSTFYDFHFASVECSTEGVCDRPELLITGLPTFNLYKDGIFIERMAGARVLSGFALFVEEFLAEKFPGTRVGGVQLGSVGDGDGDGGRKTLGGQEEVAEEEEEERERLEAIEAIWKANREKGAAVDLGTGRPKSSAIERLHRFVDGIKSIAQEWYVQQAPRGS